jgi:tetratricopeptide (TPR) repeat protein
MRPWLKLICLTATTLLLSLSPHLPTSLSPHLLPATAQTTQERKAEADRLLQQGREQYQISQFEAALQSWQQALQIYREIKDRKGEGAALGNLGIAYDALGNYGKAIEYYEQWLAIAREIKDRRGEGNALGSLGVAYRALGNYGKAIEYSEQALAILRDIKDRQGEGAVLSNFGNLFAKQQQAELAILFYKQSVNVRETIRADIRTLDRTLQESYTQSVAGTYRALADLLIEQGRIGEAQQVLERLKLQEINDFTKGTRAATTIPDVGFNATETQIKNKYSTLIAFGGKFYECEQSRCPQLGELKDQYRNLSKEFQDLVEQIKKQLQEGRLANVDKATQDFQNSADRVVTAHPNSILIYPLVLSDKTRILWAGKGGVLSKTAVCPLGEKALYAKVAQFRKFLTSAASQLNFRVETSEVFKTSEV